MMSGLPVLADLAALVRLVASRPGLYVRWSRGPESDAAERSCDHATGLELPGLAVNPLDPPGWWTLPLDRWVARQITAYAHLGDHDTDHFAWVLTGRVADRGPDNEPLLADVTPMARLTPSMLEDAAARTPRSSRPGDEDAAWQS